jgi:hypothetical protein
MEPMITGLSATARLLVILLPFFVFASSAPGQAVVADHTVIAEFDQIPTSYFDQVRAECNFYYGHTSHGSQIVTGISMLQSENALYNSPSMWEVSDDLGHSGDLTWVYPTEFYLDTHPECDVVMWSWCGGVSDNTVEGIDAYLGAMSTLEAAYPDVTFVYMTGHLDGGGPDGNLYLRNNQIRDYCYANNKILFDFADIESYDPDGTWYPNESDACNWCYDWCAAYTCPGCASCAHSHCFNCYLKGKAFWWMMARVLGWGDTECVCNGRVGDANRSGEDEPTIGDINVLIDALFFSGDLSVIPCLAEADVNASGSGGIPGPADITIGDVSYLIDYIFITGSTLGLPECP